jgi:hypothetical protein
VISTLAHQALAEDDPWEALVGFLERGQALQAAKRGLKDLMLSTGHGRDRVAAMRERLAPLADVLVRRALNARRRTRDVAPTVRDHHRRFCAHAHR